MSNLFYFVSREDLQAQQNLDLFIARSRDELTVFGADLNWENWLWPKAANFTKLGSGSRSTSPEDRMGEPFISFAKAYFRYQQGHNPTGTKNESKALKVLDKVLTDLHGCPDILRLDVVALDQAIIVAREYYDAVAYQCGRELERLAKFLADNRLADVKLGTWRNPISRPKDSNKTGKKARDERDKKMPAPDAVLAMADIFANVGEDPRDIFTSSVFALLMSGSVRITEVLQLPVDCEVFDKDKNGDPVYGLRFHSGKGYGGNVKWVPTIMVPIVQESIKRIRGITEEGRTLGKWLENTPDLMFVHGDFSTLSRDSQLTEIEACEALGLKGLSLSEAKQRMEYNYNFERNQKLSLNILWEKIRVRMPASFPWVNRDSGVTYGNALFAMQINSLHASRGTLRVLPWLPDVNIVNNDLSPRESLAEGQHQSIFARYGYSHSNGSPMKINTHQMRHMIDTMGHRGGMSEEEISRFAGRADPKQNKVYNHVTPTEIADKYEKALESAGYAESVLIHCEPVSSSAYDIAPKGPVHRSKYGFCLHDFAASPCGQFRDCLNCEEHLCEKRAATTEDLMDQLADTEEQLLASELAMNEGHYGADRWYEHHLLSAERLREMVGILSDPTVPEGSLIRLRKKYAPSHAARALSSRGDLNPGKLADQAFSRLAGLLEQM